MVAVTDAYGCCIQSEFYQTPFAVSSGSFSSICSLKALALTSGSIIDPTDLSQIDVSNDTEAVRSEEVEVDDDEEDEDDDDSNDDKDDKGNAAAAAPRGYAAKSRPSKEFGPRDEEDQHHRGLRLKSVPRRRASTPQALRHDQQQRRRAMSPPGGTEWVKRHNELARGPRVSREGSPSLIQGADNAVGTKTTLTVGASQWSPRLATGQWSPRLAIARRRLVVVAAVGTHHSS